MANKTDPTRILTADEIWAAKDIEERVVPVPQWGGAVRIRTFSKKQVSDFNKQATRRNKATGKDETDNDLLEALLFTEGVIEPKFSLEDYEKLQEKSVAALVTIVKAINAASGLSEEAVAEADKSNGHESHPQIRVLPGSGAEDDEIRALVADEQP